MCDNAIERQPIIHSAKEIYLQLLGVQEIPSSPEVLPDHVILPPVIIGDLEPAILLTESDEREREQWVYPDRKYGLKKTQLFVGSENETAIKSALITSARAFLGEMAIFEFHTHGGEKQFSPPSRKDVAQAVAYPREAFIRAVGSIHAVYAMFQTERSSRRQFPSFFKDLQVQRDYRSRQFPQSYSDLQRLSEFVNKYHFGLYYLQAPTKEGFDTGCFTKGLDLQKVQI